MLTVFSNIMLWILFLCGRKLMILLTDASIPQFDKNAATTIGTTVTKPLGPHWGINEAPNPNNLSPKEPP